MVVSKLTFRASHTLHRSVLFPATVAATHWDERDSGIDEIGNIWSRPARCRWLFRPLKYSCRMLDQYGVSPMKILIIEDNGVMALAIARGLLQHGVESETATTAQRGLELGSSSTHDAILLDIMLPDGDGIDVCRTLRHRGVSTPILLLTTLSSTEDKVAGLDAGADDYLTKPFEFDELITHSAH